MNNTPHNLTPAEVARRQRLVANIRDWERILKQECDAEARQIIEGTIKSLKEMLDKGDKGVHENKV